MLKKMRLVLMISSSVAIYAGGEPSQTKVYTEILAAQQTGTHNHFYSNKQNFSPDDTKNNGKLSYALQTAGSAIAQGVTQGIFEGIGHAVGAIIGKTLIDAFYESPDDRDARKLMSKSQQIVNLTILRRQVNFACDASKNDMSLQESASKLRLSYAKTLLAFIEKQKNEDVCIITPLLPNVQQEIAAFTKEIAALAKDIEEVNNQDTDVTAILDILTNIRLQYNLLLEKQMQYEQKSSKPAIIISANMVAAR